MLFLSRHPGKPKTAYWKSRQKFPIMKRIIFSLAFLIFTVSSFSQTSTGAAFSRDYYLKKSKTQRTTGWILLGSGVCMVVVGGLTYEQSPLLSSEPQPSNTLSDVLVISGLGAMVVSVPFFISAHHNKKMAASVAIKNANIILQVAESSIIKKQPTLSLEVSF